VRRAMTARGLTSLPLYPDDRDCLAPSAASNTTGCVDRTPSVARSDLFPFPTLRL
jgi:hypothetical protein